MVKDYIAKMLEDNEEKLDNLEQQMNELLTELKYHQEWLEKLQIEKNVDDNIFSPRSYDVESDKKIEEAKYKVEKTKNELEYIRERMETYVKEKQEYKELLNELDKQNGMKNNPDRKQSELSNGLDKIYIQEKIKYLYEKTEICLALLNGDKNKCKNELKSMLKVMKEIILKIENKEE